MGKYGNQRSWGHKDTAKDGGSKTENVRGAQNNNKTERPRGAEAKSGGIDVTSSTLTPMQGLLAWGVDNRPTDANGSSVAHEGSA